MMTYWVAYIRGSFSVKERYVRVELARTRCTELLTEARLIRLVVAEDGENAPLLNCFELPPVVSTH